MYSHGNGKLVLNKFINESIVVLIIMLIFLGSPQCMPMFSFYSLASPLLFCLEHQRNKLKKKHQPHKMTQHHTRLVKFNCQAHHITSLHQKIFREFLDYFPRGLKSNNAKTSGRYKSVSSNSVRPLTVGIESLLLKQSRTNQRSGDSAFFLEVLPGFLASITEF